MTDLNAIPILVPGRLNPSTLQRLKGIFDVEHVPDGNLATIPSERRSAIRGIAQMGRLDAEKMDMLPNLEIIANFGVGYDGIDTEHATQRGLIVTNTPDVLTEEVADTTLGLLLMTVRELSSAERHLRAGNWHTKGGYRLTPGTLRGRTVGIMGLGRIGVAIAKRLEPFGVAIAYYNRSKRYDVPYTYHSSLIDLAAAVDTLIVAAPGGAATLRAVGAKELQALGPEGILINIGRGTTVDEAALIEALENGTIMAAGLDVFEAEPHVPERLQALPNAVLLPHVGSASQHTRNEMGNLVVQNLSQWFTDRSVVTPVPETVAAKLLG